LQLSFRTKLLSIVAATTLAFVCVLAMQAWLGYRQTQSLEDVESRMVPKLELGPRLEAQFQGLRQSMQDAVAAQDSAALDDSIRLRNELIGTISSAGSALTPAEAAQLRHAVTTYHEAAYGVSRRLLRGEGGEALVDALSAMQAQQKATDALIQRTARLDRRELSGAFGALRFGTTAGTRYGVGIGIASLVLILLLSSWVARGVLTTLANMSSGMARFAKGDFSQPIPLTSNDELGQVTREANQMAASLKRSDWLRASLSELSDELRAELEPQEAARRALVFLCRRIAAVSGALYLENGRGRFVFAAGYAREGLAPDDPLPNFGPGEGLPGEAARTDEILVVNELPSAYLRVKSGLGAAPPTTLVLVPLCRLGKNLGVIELALFGAASDQARELLDAARTMLAIALEVARSRAKARELLEISQKQTELLSAQETELLTSNTELREQQEELRRANDELEVQRQALSTQNTELEEAREDLIVKARELARVSTYKSQFLANMSHELRTPLNSMLLLSHLLSENDGKNLTAKQVEYAKTIHSAGKDLLGLINQVLDLAKIEAGRQEVELSSVYVSDLADNAKRLFSAAAQQKGLTFRVEVESDLPKTLTTDRQRLERILVNLLGNALKFTERGAVGLRIFRPTSPLLLAQGELAPERMLAFAVSDSGIGIPEAAQERIFAPFEQAESRTDRRYGGTGLGLAIARESAVLLGGDLRVESREGEGSTFTCYVPEQSKPAQPVQATAPPRQFDAPPDDRSSLAAGNDYLLVVEDDRTFAEQLVELVHARRFKAVIAASGEEALLLARRSKPRGIILDVNLPDIDGWTVMERLRHDPGTRSIPVHFISGVDAPERALSLGAVGYLTKPASAEELFDAIRLLTRPLNDAATKVLIIEDNVDQGDLVADLLKSAGLASRHVTSAAAALEALAGEEFGCIVLDLGLPDMDGLGLLERLGERKGTAMPPVVVHTGRSLTREEVRRIEVYAKSVVLKGGTSAERLLDEVRLFVQYVGDAGPRPRALAGSAGQLPEISLRGQRILLADDDMRTVYALSALLRGKGADVLVAETGREALDLLGSHPDVSAVLMDVMMPEMDGYEALRRLRADRRFANVPAIALTAKAMKGERERCLEAGANDYLAKPVDPGLLLTTLKSCLETSANGHVRRS
jgi:CheY-like chemotaxis protein/signal transduction histidine kinase/HAMP domain-containing protein